MAKAKGSLKGKKEVVEKREAEKAMEEAVVVVMKDREKEWGEAQELKRGIEEEAEGLRWKAVKLVEKAEGLTRLVNTVAWGSLDRKGMEEVRKHAKELSL